MHGRDPARESMMNNDGGVMAPRYESIFEPRWNL